MSEKIPHRKKHICQATQWRRCCRVQRDHAVVEGVHPTERRHAGLQDEPLAAVAERLQRRCHIRAAGANDVAGWAPLKARPKPSATTPTSPCLGGPGLRFAHAGEDVLFRALFSRTNQSSAANDPGISARPTIETSGRWYDLSSSGPAKRHDARSCRFAARLHFGPGCRPPRASRSDQTNAESFGRQVDFHERHGSQLLEHQA